MSCASLLAGGHAAAPANRTARQNQLTPRTPRAGASWRVTLGMLLAAALTGGCGDSDTTPNGGQCAAMVDQCLVNQMSCVEASDGTAACQPCAIGSYATETGCQPIGGQAMSHTFAENTTPAGSEILGMCRSWTLNNSEAMWINAVELEQYEASHHSNWTFVPDTDFDGPDGIWKCSDRSYNQLSAALAGGVLYAQSTQANHEVQKFPDGVAIRLPPNARIISDVHTYNTSDKEISGSMTLNIYEIPTAEVTIKLAPFHLTYDELAIPPQATSRFTGECELKSHYQMQSGGPVALDVYYLLPHTHALGTRMFVEALGGDKDGQTLIDVKGFNGEARGRAYDPPLSMSGVDGLRFGCEFTNPTTEEVNWGFDDQEMCEVLGFAASPIAFESRVSEANPDGDDAGTAKFTGGCATIAFPWDHGE